MRKRLIAILMAVSLLSMSLAGCGSEDNSSADAQSTEQQTEQQEQTQDEQTQQEQTEESSKSGDVFEVMSMSDLDGNEVDSSIFADYDLTMINIWATFCNPCLSEMPELAELSSTQPVTIRYKLLESAPISPMERDKRYRRVSTMPNRSWRAPARTTCIWCRTRTLWSF